MQKKFFTIAIFILLNRLIFTQVISQSDSLLTKASIQNCINYALIHQPTLKQSLIGEEITNAEIRSKLADWFPQLNFNFNLQHAYELPTTIFQGNEVKSGLINTSSGQSAVLPECVLRVRCSPKVAHLY